MIEHGKKPYLKVIDRIGEFTVWIVDGTYIRRNIDEEFTNFGQHFRFRFIPRHEFWIDRERAPGEEHYFVDHLLKEWALMAKGMGYDQALARADAVENLERRRSEMVRETARLSRKKAVERIHRQLLKTYSGTVQVWVVSGDLVRSLYFIDFTEGGHEFVYPRFVPRNEVWLDDDLDPRERRYVLLHELHERHLMSLGWAYYKAHRSASGIEFHCRAHPEDLEAALRREARLNREK
jgi:hypothetical protein